MKPLLSIIAYCITMTLIVGCETTQQGIPAAQLRANLNSISLGMSKQEVIALVGKPIRVNQTLDASGTTDQWVYSDSQFWTAGQAFAAGLATGGSGPVHESELYLYFKNDKLTSIQKQQ